MRSDCKRSVQDMHWCDAHHADFWEQEPTCHAFQDEEVARTFARESLLVMVRRPDATAARVARPDSFSRELLDTAHRAERCGCCGRVEALDQRLACEDDAYRSERDDERRSGSQ